jgi:outer membrane PBP1 activator LpoA protein
MKSLLKWLSEPNHAPSLLCIPVLGLLIFSGCTPMPSESAMPVQKKVPAEAAVQTSPYEQAPGVSQQPAPTLSDEQIRQRLQKVEALIQSGENIAAGSFADTINPSDLSIAQQSLLNLFYAQIFLGTGEAEQAGKSLSYISPEQLDLQHRIEYYQSQAFAFSLNGQPLDSAKSRIALNELLASPEQREENNAAILETLALVSDDAVDYAPSPATDQLAGWLSLAKIIKLKGQPGFSELITQWRETYAGHPANAAYLENVQESPQNNKNQPLSIALFLPESGPFAEVGKAIRAGFMAAYNDPGNNVHKPAIHFYDSEQATPQFLYNQAITDGAGLIIGPLQKEAVQSLADLVNFQVPVLALNHVPGLERDNLYQFGLSPIDDVEEITQKAWRDGRQNALLLVPDNAQGNRIAEYFVGNWQNRGGNIVESLAFRPKETDFSETIKKLLKLNGNENRANEIEEATPDGESRPQRRQDADALFLNANSFEARLINPQLHYYQTDRLPVYATPGVYSGRTNAARDSDLDHIVFCDAPWMLDKAYLGTLSMNALQAAWQSFSGSYLRLFAMGMDAYHLAFRLKTLDMSPYDGATGKLSLVTDNRIKRNLACAQFKDGLPVVTDPLIPETESSTTVPETVIEAQPVPEEPVVEDVVQ